MSSMRALVMAGFLFQLWHVRATAQERLFPSVGSFELPEASPRVHGFVGRLTTSGYHSKEGEVTTDLGTIRTGSVLLMLEAPLFWRLSWRGGVGVVHYWPTEDTGIFSQGGPTRFLVGGGVDYRSRAMSGWDFLMSLRYDFHRFTTEELKLRGFAGNQGVQRVSASLGLARSRR